MIVSFILTVPHLEMFVPGVGGFPVDAFVYCEANPYSQLLVHGDICGFIFITTYSGGGFKYFFTFLDAVFTHRSAGFEPLLYQRFSTYFKFQWIFSFHAMVLSCMKLGNENA